MGKQFLIEVHPQRIVALEVERTFDTVHAKALVDGDMWTYQIVKSKNCSSKDRTWFSRGMNYTHYHAKNSGFYVKFQPIERKSKKAKKISPKQIPMVFISKDNDLLQ